MTRVVPRPKKLDPEGFPRVTTHRLSINMGMLGTGYAFFHRLGTLRYEVHFRDVASGGEYFDIAFKASYNSVEFEIPNSPDLIGAEWQIKVVTT